MGIIGWIIVGIIAGWIAEKIMGRDDSLIMNLIIGLVGAFVGGGILKLLNIGGSNGWILSIVTAVVGAVVLLWIVGLIRGRAAKK